MKAIKLVVLSGLIAVILPLAGISQTNQIIIGSSADSMQIVNTHDTVLTTLNQGGWYDKFYYKIDLDQNRIPDFTFSTQGYMGGMASWNYFRLESDDNSWFSTDSVVTTIGVYDSVGQCHYFPDTVLMVRIYNNSDTLFSDNCTESNPVDIAHYSFQDHNSCLMFNLDNWISGTHYIGIKKSFNNLDYLGWIKVQVEDAYTMVIKEYAINHFFVGIPRSSEPHQEVYPNPVNSTLIIANPACNRVEICNVFGNVVKAVDVKNNTADAVINVENLRPGIYLVRIFSRGSCITRKIIKS